MFMSPKMLFIIAYCILASDGLRLCRKCAKAGSSAYTLTTLQNKTQHGMQHNDADVRESSSQKQNPPYIHLLCGMSFLLVMLIGCVAVGVSAPQPAPCTQECPIQNLQDADISMNMIRMSGEHITSLRAKPHWRASELEQLVTAQLLSNEHVHSILYETNAGLQRISDFACIGEIGIKDGETLRVIVLPSCTLPSGVALYSCTKHIAGPMGARGVANIWLHEESFANVEYGKILDVGMEQLAYVNGILDDEGRLHLQNDVHTNQAIVEHTAGIPRTFNLKLKLPDLGDVQLKQEIPDAIFDLGQTSEFYGWISLFKCSEMVIKLAKRTSESTSHYATHLRIKVSKAFLLDGHDVSIKLSCEKCHDFLTWDAAGELEDRGSSWSATLKGPVGCRKLTLIDFPMVGNLELIEHPFCSALTQR